MPGPCVSCGPLRALCRRHADLWADVVRAAHHPRHAPAAAGPAAVWALPLLGHCAVPAVWPQHAKRFLQPRRKVARLMDILLSIIGSAVLAALLAAAYTAGLCAGKAAAHLDEDDEPKIYMDHTHGGED